MSDSWATAFNLSYLAAGSSMEVSGRLVALAGQRQAEQRLRATTADLHELMEQNAVLWHDLQRFDVYGRNVAAENLALRGYIGRLAEEIAALRRNEALFVQEVTNLRDYNDRLREENAAWKRYGDRLCEENAALEGEVADLLADKT